MDKLLTYYNEIMNATFGRLTWAIVVAMAVYFVLDFIFKRISKMLPSELSNNPSKPILIFMKIGKFLVFIIILLLTLDSLGVKVVSLLAGLGIGGLAIAFAAQKVLKSFPVCAVEYEFAFDVTPPDSHMDVQEKINLAILDAFAERNIIMAYPAQKVLLEKS